MTQTFRRVQYYKWLADRLISYRASLCIALRKNCSQGTLARVQTFRCQYWMKVGARPVDDITIMRFLLLSPRRDGANDSARQLVAATKIARTVLAGGLVLVPIDSTNYSQTRRYRGPFSWTLFSRSIDRSLFYEHRCMVRRVWRWNKILRFAGQCNVITPCIHNPVHSARRFLDYANKFFESGSRSCTYC